MKILGFIPARGGSKGIKNKNLRSFDGKPLIFHTIKVSKKNKLITPFVSTDLKKILNYAKKNQIKFDYLRPKRLSGNKSNVIDAVFHALDWLEKKNLKFDAVMLLQPTSPIRIDKEIKKIINQFKDKKLSSIVSVVENENSYDTVQVINNHWKYTVKNKNKTTNRQNFKNKSYIIDGSMYLSKVSFLKKYKSFVKPNITKLFKSSVKPMVDINIMLDLKVAEILRKKIYKY